VLQLCGGFGGKETAKTLKAAGREAEFYTYASATLWFFENDRAGSYNVQAIDMAWNRTSVSLW
jgi:hypothetical protein